MNPDELARLEADLAALEARLADPTFTSKNSHQRLAEERQFRDSLRMRIESERARIAKTVPIVPGGLPSQSTGHWQPLPLHEQPQLKPPEGELPLAPLAGAETEEPDRAAVARELTLLLSQNVGRLAPIAKRWGHDAQLRPLILAALRLRGYWATARELDPHGRTVEQLNPRIVRLPPTPFLTMATELPDEFTGLTATQQLVLEVLRAAAPHGGPFVRLSVIAAEVTVRKPECSEAEVERVLIALGHPSLRRLPLVELQGFTGRFDPHDTHCTHARLTRVGLEALDETFPLPLILVNGAEGRGACIPPHSPRELALAARSMLEDQRASVSDLDRFIEGPDFPDGGAIVRTGIQLLWSRGESELWSFAKVGIETDANENARVVIAQLPWPLTGRAVKSSVHELMEEGALPGVKAVNDHSSATGQRVEIEFEHLAYAMLGHSVIRQTRIHQIGWKAEFLVADDANPRRIDLEDLLRTFIEHRKEVAVKRLDKAVVQARVRTQGAEAVCLALALLEPVLAVMRAALDDDEAVKGLMNFMRPEYREAIQELPFQPSHDYATGFTEQQARHLLTVRKLPSRQPESAQRDWAALQSEVEAAKARLSDRQAILDLVREELRAAAERFSEPRRTSVL